MATDTKTGLELVILGERDGEARGRAVALARTTPPAAELETLLFNSAWYSGRFADERAKASGLVDWSLRGKAGDLLPLVVAAVRVHH